MHIYLTGNQYLISSADEEEVQSVLAAYDNRSCDRILIKEEGEVFHVAKAHIVAIHISVEKQVKHTLN